MRVEASGNQDDVLRRGTTDSIVTKVMEIVVTQDNALVACVVVNRMVELRVRLMTTVRVTGARGHLGNSAVLEGS